MGDRVRSVGRGHSSEEAPVMGVERRASVIQSNHFGTTEANVLKEDDKRIDKIITDPKTDGV